MLLTIKWFEEELIKSWGLVVNSEAKKELMRRELEMLWLQKRKFEKTNSWQVPLKIEFDINNIQGTWRIVIADESTVLIMEQ